MTDLRYALRRMRRLTGMKQSHAAELLGVTQATISRWEHGTHQPSSAQRATLRALLAAPLGRPGDAVMRRFIEASMLPLHLVCDATHRLLALSRPRAAEWRADPSELLGRSLWRYASPEIQAAEARLAALGWYEPAARALAFRTNANADPMVPIAPGTTLWERLRLDDGSEARLVTTLASVDQARHAGVIGLAE